MSFKSMISNATFELKIALFCVVLILLSYVYMIMEPVIGEYVLKVSIVTFVMSLIMFFYKMLFNSINSFITIIILLSLYICALAKIFNAIWLMRIAFFVAIFVIAIKAFKVIFFGRSSKDSVEDIDTLGDNKCPNCGGEITKNDTFCSHCGKKIR